MHWENNTEEWPDVPEEEIPAELLDGLDRLSADGELVKARLRWRPFQTSATGFLTKDRLLEIRGEPVAEIALALASHACHLHDQGGCEAKFEAQIQRELEARGPDGAREREWRSITFYVHQPGRAPDYASDDDVPHDDDPYDPTRYSPAWEEPARPSTTRAPSPDAGRFAQYQQFVALYRSDPTAFAMILLLETNDRIVTVFDRLLMSSVARLDRVIGTQVSGSRHLNEALQTLTKGAADVAGLGVDLYGKGLESQARVAQMEHETELGKERTTVLRDAVKHGSLLLQAVVMSQTKQRPAKAPSAAPPPPTPSAAPPPPTPSAEPGPSAATAATAQPSEPPAPPPAPPPAASTGPDADIEAKTNRLLELVTDDGVDELREQAPSLAAVFDELRAEPVTADRVREIIVRAEKTVDPEELGLASEHFGPEVSRVFGLLLMRVLSEAQV